MGKEYCYEKVYNRLKELYEISIEHIKKEQDKKSKKKVGFVVRKK